MTRRRSTAAVPRSSARMPEPFEVIVVIARHRPPPPRSCARRSPTVTLVELAEPALPGEARNAGLRRRPRRPTFRFPAPTSSCPPGSLAARVAAHQRGYAMVTGVDPQRQPHPAGWASYFLDHSSACPAAVRPSSPGRPGPLLLRPRVPARGGRLPRGLRAGEDTAVNRSPGAVATVAYREQRIELVHRSPCRTPWRLRGTTSSAGERSAASSAATSPGRGGGDGSAWCASSLVIRRAGSRAPMRGSKSGGSRCAASIGAHAGWFGSGSRRRGSAPASSCCCRSAPRRRSSGPPAGGPERGSAQRRGGARDHRVALVVVAGERGRRTEPRSARRTARR